MKLSPSSRTPENSFVFGKMVTGKHFVDREAERNELMPEIEQHFNIIFIPPDGLGRLHRHIRCFLI